LVAISNKISSIFDVIIIALLIFSSGGLLFVFNRNLMYGCLVFFVLFSLFFLGKKILRKNFNVAVSSFISITGLFIINYLFAISEQSINKYLYYLMIIFTTVSVLLHFKNNRSNDIMIGKIYLVLKLVMFHSLLQVFAYPLISGDLTTIITKNGDYNCETFNYFLFYSSLEKQNSFINLFGIDFFRNQGLFWEAGVLQLFLNIFFFLEAFIMQKRRYLLLLTSLAIITTYSTAGITILLLQGLYYIFSEYKRNKLLLPLIVVCLIPIYSVFTVNIEEKISGEREASFQKRFFDLVQPFYIALENPITGVGLDLEQFQKYRYEFHFSSNRFKKLQEQVGITLKMEGTDRGSSNSFMFLLACMGFPTAILLIYMFFNQRIILKNKTLLLTIISLSLLSSPLILRPFFFVFIVSGFFSIFDRLELNRTLIS